jgi:hypothetical protein
MDKFSKDFLNNFLIEQDITPPIFINAEYPEFIRKTLENIYRKKAPQYWGKINTPTCQTNFGVLNVFEHPGEEGGWSILNRFDTNYKVKNAIKEIYDSENPTEDFQTWIWKNREKLFGENGEYTQRLVDVNKTTILSGANREETAINKLNEKFGEGTIIKRFCSGDKRDTLKGQDLLVETPNGVFTVQVKPYGKIDKFIDDEGSVFYEVHSRGYDPTKYSPLNVQTIMFVGDDKFAVFVNSRSKIGKVADGVTRFYEEPLYTNMTFDKEKTKNRSKSTKMVKQVFDYGSKESEINRLEIKKAALERLIQKLKGNNNGKT